MNRCIWYLLVFFIVSANLAQIEGRGGRGRKRRGRIQENATLNEGNAGENDGNLSDVATSPASKVEIENEIVEALKEMAKARTEEGRKAAKALNDIQRDMRSGVTLSNAIRKVGEKMFPHEWLGSEESYVGIAFFEYVKKWMQELWLLKLLRDKIGIDEVPKNSIRKGQMMSQVKPYNKKYTISEEENDEQFDINEDNEEETFSTTNSIGKQGNINPRKLNRYEKNEEFKANSVTLPNQRTMKVSKGSASQSRAVPTKLAQTKFEDTRNSADEFELEDTDMSLQKERNNLSQIRVPTRKLNVAVTTNQGGVKKEQSPQRNSQTLIKKELMNGEVSPKSSFGKTGKSLSTVAESIEEYESSNEIEEDADNEELELTENLETEEMLDTMEEQNGFSTAQNKMMMGQAAPTATNSYQNDEVEQSWVNSGRKVEKNRIPQVSGNLNSPRRSTKQITVIETEESDNSSSEDGLDFVPTEKIFGSKQRRKKNQGSSKFIDQDKVPANHQRTHVIQESLSPYKATNRFALLDADEDSSDDMEEIIESEDESENLHQANSKANLFISPSKTASEYEDEEIVESASNGNKPLVNYKEIETTSPSGKKRKILRKEIYTGYHPSDHSWTPNLTEAQDDSEILDGDDDDLQIVQHSPQKKVYSTNRQHSSTSSTKRGNYPSNSDSVKNSKSSANQRKSAATATEFNNSDSVSSDNWDTFVLGNGNMSQKGTSSSSSTKATRQQNPVESRRGKQQISFTTGNARSSAGQTPNQNPPSTLSLESPANYSFDFENNSEEVEANKLEGLPPIKSAVKRSSFTEGQKEDNADESSFDTSSSWKIKSSSRQGKSSKKNPSISLQMSRKISPQTLSQSLSTSADDNAGSIVEQMFSSSSSANPLKLKLKMKNIPLQDDGPIDDSIATADNGAFNSNTVKRLVQRFSSSPRSMLQKPMLSEVDHANKNLKKTVSIQKTQSEFDDGFDTNSMLFEA